jgi:hypothetical protein
VSLSRSQLDLLREWLLELEVATACLPELAHARDLWPQRFVLLMEVIPKRDVPPQSASPEAALELARYSQAFRVRLPRDTGRVDCAESALNELVLWPS